MRSSRRDEFDKDIELMVLHHEMRILEHQVRGRVRYRRVDRAIPAALSRLLPRCHWRSFLVTPDVERNVNPPRWTRVEQFSDALSQRFSA